MIRLTQHSVGKPSLEVSKGKGDVEDIDMQQVGNVRLLDNSFTPGSLSKNNCCDKTAPTDDRPTKIKKEVQ